MRLTRKRGIALIVGITVFLVAFGVALAVTWIQVSQSVPTVLSISPTVIISGDNIALWHDTAKTLPVTGDPALAFSRPQSQPPLRQIFGTTGLRLIPS